MARSWLACSSTAVSSARLRSIAYSTARLQHLGFDPALDQVVLRARRHRRHPEVLVGRVR